jgi:lipoate-protein ligase B
LFDTIIPCGIRDRGVTSMAAELHAAVSMNDVRNALEKTMRHNFSA